MQPDRSRCPHQQRISRPFYPAQSGFHEKCVQRNRKLAKIAEDVIGALGRELEQVRITDLREGTFFAELVFDGDIRVSARPSDSVALALRIGVPIHAEDSVLQEAGLIIPDEQEDEVEKFREFLDSVSPEDFRGADT